MNHKRILLFGLGIAAWLLPVQCFADDGAVDIAGGSARLMAEHPAISMSDEYVLITMLPDKYRVKAEFHFYNAGPSTTVAVGFPADGWGPEASASDDFLYFKTWVNGQIVSTKNIPNFVEGYVAPLEEDMKTGTSYYFKVKYVDFPARSTTTSVVEYEAPYGRSSDGGSWVPYDYGTGGSWKGPIGKASFDIRFDEDWLGLGVVYSRQDGQKEDLSSPRHRSRGQIVFDLNGINPLSSASLTVFFHRRDACLALSSNSAYCDIITSADDMDSNTQTLALLKIKRNAVFARHGRVFKDPELRQFFLRKEWYEPQNGFESSLSDIEREMIARIQKKEKRIAESKPLPAPF
ncbi:MAG: hypothetical protein A2X37_06400 [Elusimicrobia bacterium GWA2_66_18]|nr:MAG: hypothetical protein A2X37_06400 [Elusimicrobia bacterium GWA2_66_18]